MSKLWGGRFSLALDESAVALSYSLSTDQRLYKEDIFLNRAHAMALHEANLLSDQEFKD